MNHSHQTSAATLRVRVPQIVMRERTATAPTLRTRLIESLRAWQQRRRSRRDLLMLDDHLLRDIGLTRDQIATESSKPFWRV
jgi:uncharacterized protein YjiS (DUF1127 family)